MQDFKLKINEKYTLNCTFKGKMEEVATAVIHLNSASTNNTNIIFFKIPADAKYCFLCPNLPGNFTESPYKSFSTNSSYIKVIVDIIAAIKKDYPNIKKIILSGESWGSNLCMLFANKHPNLIDGVVCWNGPSWIVKPNDPNKLRENIVLMSTKHVLTLLFNIRFFCNSGDLSELTDNQIMKRLNSSLTSKTKYNTDVRIDIATFRSMFFAFRYMTKHFKKQSKLPFIYIQSKQDIYYAKNKKWIDKMLPYCNENNQVIIVEKGYHLLAYDQNNNDKVIWDSLKKLSEK